MVAIIKTGHSLHSIFNYNENKVKEGVAECIDAGNYPVDVEKMSVKMKLIRLLKQIELNERVSRNSVHISLNFDVSENGLSRVKLTAIAETYMEQLGFGRQPYLVYQHFDAGHPHIHIVTTNIEADGKRIDLHLLGIRKSEPARKAIEESFGLVKAEAQGKTQFELKPVSSQKVIYGKSETKRAIQNVLDVVANQYKYSSVPELNAVLRQYNVFADRGTENSRTYRNNGLLYRILDEHGKPVGVPIKASAFYSKPTLKNLEAKYTPNTTAKQPHKARVKNAIDLTLRKRPGITVKDLAQVLEKQGINVVVRQNDDGIIYGLTYVDHQTKCVFNGSALGKAYSAKGILERCIRREEQQRQTPDINPPFSKQVQTANADESPLSQPEKTSVDLDFTELLETLLRPEYTSGYVPYQLTAKGRKKKKRRGSKPR